MNADDLEKTIAHLGLELFEDETRQRVESLLANGQSVEPDVRIRMIGAAQRGLRQHALEHEVFEVLAFETRKRSDVSGEVLARDLGVDAGALRQVERGKSPLNSFDVDVVACWIDVLGLDDDVALRAVKSSLRSHRVENSYASADDELALEGDAQVFFEGVRDALLNRRQSQ